MFTNRPFCDARIVTYDLVGKVAAGTTLTRKTVAQILKGISTDKLAMFSNNPEEFIAKVVKLINEQKATMIVEHIVYDPIEGEYDSSIFTAEKSTQSFDKAFVAKKAIQTTYSPTDRQKRVLRGTLLRTLIPLEKFAYMLSFLGPSRFQRQLEIIHLTGQLRSTRIQLNIFSLWLKLKEQWIA